MIRIKILSGFKYSIFFRCVFIKFEVWNLDATPQYQGHIMFNREEKNPCSLGLI